MTGTLDGGTSDGGTGRSGARRVRRVPRTLSLLYNLVFLVVFVCHVPFILWRMVRERRIRRSLGERRGMPPPTRPGQRLFWVHGVSVGEVKAAAPFVEEVSLAFPSREVVISATTPTGIQRARGLYPGRAVIHFPLDFAGFPGRALDRIRPDCVFLLETEMWPNFLDSADQRGIPVVVINGRISAKSFRGYRRVRRLVPQFDLVRLYCVQNDTYAERLIALDIPRERVAVTGNLKYDAVKVREATGRDAELVALLGVRPEERVLVCGSTHGDEERVLHETAQRARAITGLPVRLVVTPRHPERVAAVLESIAAAQGTTVCWSRLKAGQDGPPPAAATVVVDTIGELERFYGLADLAFVGGSLIPRGGQNMLEPAALGKATLFGPHIQNFQADVDVLLSGGGARMVQDREELLAQVCALLRDPAAAAALGQAAARVIRANQGATLRTLAAIRERLPEARQW